MNKITRTVFPIRHDEYDSPRRTYVVLGAPRGGTSMIAGLLRLFGIPMGPNLGHQHEDPRFRTDTSLALKIEAINTNNNLYERWGWKLPDNIYYYNDLSEYLLNPVFIAVYRNPLAIAISSVEHDNLPLDFDKLNVPNRHYGIMNRLIEKHDTVPCIGISYDVATQKEKRAFFIRDFSTLLGIELTKNSEEKAISFIDPSSGYKELEWNDTD